MEPGGGGTDIHGAPRDEARIESVLEVLASEPDWNALARELTLGYFSHLRAHCLHLAYVHSDASLRSLGSFGLPRETLARLDGVSLLESLPMTRAVRLNEIVVELDHSKVADLPLYSTTGECNAICSVPLSSSIRIQGILTFASESPPASAEAFKAAAGALQGPLTAYIAGWMASRKDFDTHAPDDQMTVLGDEDLAGDVNHRTPELLPHLTQRQKRILALVSNGLTYRQVASEIRFSQSTVREELMKIYRMLQVSSRDAATDACLRWGVITRDSVEENLLVRIDQLNPN